jgi:large subunit ribosomal protein L15
MSNIEETASGPGLELNQEAASGRGLKLHHLRPAPGAHKAKMRVGRG